MNDAHPYIKNDLLADLLRPRRMAFIVNPKAGTNLQRHIRESVDKHLNHRRFEYGFKFTERAGHARELALEAISEGYNIVTAVGGDGSINEVASALVDTDAILGIVPAGSGNGLAMHLGYGREVDEAVQKLNLATERTIDIGLLNGRPFVNLAGIDGFILHQGIRHGIEMIAMLSQNSACGVVTTINNTTHFFINLTRGIGRKFTATHTG